MIKGTYKLDYNLAPLTWFKVGGSADVLFKPEDTEDLAKFMKQNAGILPVTVLGAGSNIIFRDGGVHGVVVKLGRSFTDIEIVSNNELSVGAACLNYNLAKFTQGNSIKNFEFLIGIPGTVGGGVAMNAGSYGSEFCDIVKSIEIVDKDGNIKVIAASDIGFSYRKNSLPKGTIVTKVIFKTEIGDIDEIKSKMAKISKERSETQPITEKTGGSTFANPEGYKAWELIDKAGLRGKSVGDAIISTKHCNFMINNGNATAKDIEELGEFVRAEVKEKLGVELQWEIKLIGRNAQI